MHNNINIKYFKKENTTPCVANDSNLCNAHAHVSIAQGVWNVNVQKQFTYATFGYFEYCQLDWLLD